MRTRRVFPYSGEPPVYQRLYQWPLDIIPFEAFSDGAYPYRDIIMISVVCLYVRQEHQHYKKFSLLV